MISKQKSNQGVRVVSAFGRRSAVLLALFILFPVSLPARQGDAAAAGAALFNGTSAFQNGGAQCIACHGVAAIAPPGGGSLGPDLSGAFQKYNGAQGLTSVLAGMPFPTMAPVYRNHALTSQEQADLVAYLGTASAGLPSSNTIFVAALGVWVLSALYLILQYLWPRRLGHVRASLQAR
jgi:mono/diheme cytochrome c family protein